MWCIDLRNRHDVCNVHTSVLSVIHVSRMSFQSIIESYSDKTHQHGNDKYFLVRETKKKEKNNAVKIHLEKFKQK